MKIRSGLFQNNEIGDENTVNNLLNRVVNELHAIFDRQGYRNIVKMLEEVGMDLPNHDQYVLCP